MSFKATILLLTFDLVNEASTNWNTFIRRNIYVNTLFNTLYYVENNAHLKYKSVCEKE